MCLFGVTYNFRFIDGLFSASEVSKESAATAVLVGRASNFFYKGLEEVSQKLYLSSSYT